MLLEATWKTDDPAALLLQQQRVFKLIDLFQECDASVLPFACPFDLTLTLGLGTIYGSRGTWVSGVGFESAVYSSGGFFNSQLGVIFSYATPFVCTSAEAHYSLVKGSPVPAGFTNGIQLFNGGSLVAQDIVDSRFDADGVNRIRTATPASPSTIDEIDFFTTMYGDPSSGPFGDCQLFDLLINGIGVGPC
jgi:hypothetical protein